MQQVIRDWVSRVIWKSAHKLGLCNIVTVEQFRDGNRIRHFCAHNGLTTEGKNKILDVMFDSGTQITIWYAGLINNAGFTALAATDTYDNINQAGNGWDEFGAAGTGYTDANNGGNANTRPVWNPGEPSGGSISNTGAEAVYDITGTATVKGIFVVGGGSTPQNKADDTAGSTLWATALFTSGDVSVVSSDQLRVTYTVSC